MLASELQADLRLSHRDILRSDVRYSKDDEDEDDEAPKRQTRRRAAKNVR